MIRQENKAIKELEDSVKDYREEVGEGRLNINELTRLTDRNQFEVAGKLARIHLNQLSTEDREMLDQITKEFRDQISQAKETADNDFKAALHVIKKITSLAGQCWWLWLSRIYQKNPSVKMNSSKKERS